MRRGLEEDPVLFQAFALADYLKRPVAAASVAEMTLAEFIGWQEYFDLKEERRTDG